MASDSSSWGRLVTCSRMFSATTRPITEAVSRTCFDDFLEMVDARRNHRLHSGGQRNCIDATFQAVCALHAFEIAALGDGIDKLFEEKRVTLRALDDVPAEQFQRRILAKMLMQQLECLLCGQGRHADLPIVCSLHKGCHEARPEIDQKERRGPDDSIGQSLDELFAGRIDPMQILDQDNSGAVTGACVRESSDEIQ